MNENIILAGVLLVALAAVGRNFYKKYRGTGGSCGCGKKAGDSCKK